jgi:hypothetical protein
MQFREEFKENVVKRPKKTTQPRENLTVCDPSDLKALSLLPVGFTSIATRLYDGDRKAKHCDCNSYPA